MGTKDKIAQHWIDILIQTAHETRAASPGRNIDEISNEFLIWLSKETNEPYNPLLDLPYTYYHYYYISFDINHRFLLVFDPSQDTLVEILRTILLGDAKYTWYELHHNWTAVQQDIFAIRLQGTNLDGLRVPPIRATMIFHILALFRALGELAPILWMPVIDNMEEYLVRQAAFPSWHV
ncbi:hypothetical protein B0H13DRAFT_2302086 [Mycena leptocephala]|nr:hypothetical protein B0H13DRAFT_2302086 [Mycena leptocephala]